MSNVPATAETLLENLDGGALPGADLAWVRDLRQQGRAAFLAAGLPSRKTEIWKYTDVQRLARGGFAASGAPGSVDSEKLAQIDRLTGDQPRAVFVDGSFDAGLSRLPDTAGVAAAGLADLLGNSGGAVIGRLGRVAESEDRPFIQLNQALMGDGLVLTVGRRAVLDRPLHLVFVGTAATTGRAIHPRVLIVLESEAAATVVEHHISADGEDRFVNAVTEVAVGDGARLNHYKWQGEGDGTYHYAGTLATVGRDARYENFVLTTGARQSRNEMVIRLTEPGSDLVLSGGYLVNGDRHTDTTTRIEHLAPDCTSREVYKGVLDGRARGVFQGKIYVDRLAQRTDGHQMARALILSDKAEANTKPELEIYADDVKCSHGATVGEIDKDHLFYLQSRGIGLNEARRLLVDAFVIDALADISDEAVRAQFTDHVAGWMAG